MYDPQNFISESCIFDVTSFGAVGNCSTDDIDAFRAARKAACAVESGVLLAPADYTFIIRSTIFSGPCKPGVVFQVDGVLVALDGPDCWPKSDSLHQWLVFYLVDGMTFTGNGAKWWELPCKPHRGPHGTTLPGKCGSPGLIRFFMSSNIVVRVLVENLSLNSPAHSPNTDGIHIADTKSVGIYNSIIANGDDCISIGPGCSDVDIEGVTCEHSHGIRNSDNGVRIKTWQGGSGSVTGVSFENIEMENVRNCIIIDQYYSCKGCQNETSSIYVNNVSYKGIKGTYDVRSPPIHFACSDAIACTNLTLSEVELLPADGEMVDDPYCWNAYGTQETLTIPTITCLLDGEPQLLSEDINYFC
ncbi:hypothetical protein GIB67_011287 [Kingdonia uniflora]|uniref:Polygalacturonase n=1 Tax=Kingdonia uniflora TaxID=39325 RepID=A0A7J7MNM3_9MAGN|nr:hypothetical protein GIB67_011287 [Kingdonia uniflora]